MTEQSRRPTRRDFLRGRAWVDAAREAVQHVFPPGEEAGAGEELNLLRVSRYAMGTTFTICVPAAVPDAMDAATAALDLIERLEQKLTVYDDNSEVQWVNRLAAQRPVPVSPELMELLELSLRLYEETGGAFDPAMGAVIHAWGFVRGPRRVPTKEELAQAMAASGSRWIELDRDRQTVRFLRPGMQLNFGSIGKGYALDKAAFLLRSCLGEVPVLLQGGQSSVLARGRPSSEGWRVGIANPLEPGERFMMVSLHDEALGTASNLIQFVDAGGCRYGHVLDPRTGRPAEGLLQVSVVAPDAATADALATALLVMGAEAAERYCAAHPEIGAVLVSEGAEGTVQVRTLGPLSDRVAR